MSGSDTAAATLAAPRPGLAEVGYRATVVTTAFAAIIFTTRLSGPALIEALVTCFAIAIGAEVIRRREHSRLIASIPFALAVSVLLGVGIAALGAPGRMAFLPALFILSTFATTIAPIPILACSAVVAFGLFVPALGNDASALGWTAPATALVLLVVPQLVCVVSRIGRGGQITGPAAPSSVPSDHAAMTLTRRQSQAVGLAATGLRQAEIAERMDVSIHQVRNLLRQARQQNGADTTRELIARSITAAHPSSHAEKAADTQK